MKTFSEWVVYSHMTVPPDVLLNQLHSYGNRLTTSSVADTDATDLGGQWSKYPPDQSGSCGRGIFADLSGVDRK